MKKNKNLERITNEDEFDNNVKNVIKYARTCAEIGLVGSPIIAQTIAVNSGLDFGTITAASVFFGYVTGAMYGIGSALTKDFYREHIK